MSLVLRRLSRLAPLVPLAAVLLACGGSVVTLGPDGGDGGNPACPAPGIVGSAGSCSDPGLMCSSALVLPTCGDGGTGTSFLTCTCSNGAWSCPDIPIQCPGPPHPCPEPAQIVPNGSCTSDPGLSCLSNIPIVGCDGEPHGYVSCTCESGGWSCDSPSPLCPVDAGGCPPPDSTFAGQGCAYYAGTCGGDPQSCGGETLYDALQCSAGVWTVVASTQCDVDAGTGADGI
jgi:hypothetical protein